MSTDDERTRVDLRIGVLDSGSTRQVRELLREYSSRPDVDLVIDLTELDDSTS